MARRGQDKSDKLHNRRKQELVESDFQRKINMRNKIPDIILSCEDKVSAPAYFQKIIDKLIDNRKITQDSFVIVPHEDITHPSGVLDKLKSYKDDNSKTYEDFQHKWIVIDRDTARVNSGGHTSKDFNNALKDAEKNNIKVAYANDSFELWYLLHFNYIDSAIFRDDIIEKLIIKLKERNKHIFSKLNKDNIKNSNYTNHIFSSILENQEEAIKHAKKLLDTYGDTHNPEKDNPSTTVHQLVQILNDLDKTSTL